MRQNKTRPAKRLILAAWAAALSLLLTSCLQTSTAGDPHKVALVVKSAETQFFLSMFAGAQAAAAEYNIDLTITAPESEEDYAAQNTLVEQAVADGTEVILFSATDYENTADAIDAAAQKGVGIIAIDSDVNSTAVASYIGTDNYAAGAMAARAALERVEGELNVGIINYGLNSANGQERERGARETLTDSGRVGVVQTINTRAEAKSAQADTEALLQEHPEINVLLAFNEPTSVGAAAAVRGLEMSDTVFLVGFDSNVDTVDDLQTGEVDALVVQNPYAMGYLGVESAYKLLTGRARELQSIVDTSTRIVDRDNLFAMDSQKALFAFD